MQTPRGSRLVRAPLYSSPSSRAHLENKIAHKGSSSLSENIPPLLMPLNEVEKLDELVKEHSSSRQSVAPEETSNHITIKFPDTRYRNESRISVSLNNPATKSAYWVIKSIGPAYVSTPKLKYHPLNDQVFKFLALKGKVEADSSIHLTISFFPLIAGTHAQTFHLRAQNQVIVMELQGQSFAPTVSKPFPYPSSRPSEIGNRALPFLTPHPVKIQQKKPAVSQSEPAKNRVRDALPPKPPAQSLDFGQVAIYDCPSRKIHICNDRVEATEYSLKLVGPFAIPLNSFWVEPKSYVALPIAFVPRRKGSFTGDLIVKESRGRVSRIRLMGKGV